MVDRFVRTESVNKGKLPGRPSASDESVQDVKNRLEQSPNKPIRKCRRKLMFHQVEECIE